MRDPEPDEEDKCTQCNCRNCEDELFTSLLAPEPTTVSNEDDDDPCKSRVNRQKNKDSWLAFPLKSQDCRDDRSCNGKSCHQSRPNQRG